MARENFPERIRQKSGVKLCVSCNPATPRDRTCKDEASTIQSSQELEVTQVSTKEGVI